MMKVNGAEVDKEGCETALDVMIKNGFDVPFECRSGVCGSCRCKIEGTPKVTREMVGYHAEGETLLCSVSSESEININV